MLVVSVKGVDAVGEPGAAAVGVSWCRVKAACIDSRRASVALICAQTLARVLSSAWAGCTESARKRRVWDYINAQKTGWCRP